MHGEAKHAKIKIQPSFYVCGGVHCLKRHLFQFFLINVYIFSALLVYKKCAWKSAEAWAAAKIARLISQKHAVICAGQTENETQKWTRGRFRANKKL
jgi:hypothetical protein